MVWLLGNHIHVLAAASNQLLSSVTERKKDTQVMETESKHTSALTLSFKVKTDVPKDSQPERCLHINSFRLR